MRHLRAWQSRSLALAGALLALGAFAPATAQEEPLTVIYGPQALSAEGDYDYREVVYFEVPASVTDRLYLRVFDPDTGGEHDLIYGEAADTEVRFTLFGGAGAASVGAPPPVDPEDAWWREGVALAELSVGQSTVADDTWQTLASFLPEEGDEVGERRVFRLVVEGIAGDDANLFTPTLSVRDRRNQQPPGLRAYAFAPTVRVPDDRRVTEARFAVPSDATILAARNFDAASGELRFATTFREVALSASGQDEWAEDDVALREDEPGSTAAILLAGGTEIPNDVTIVVTDAAGEPLPIELPVHAVERNTRPVPIAEVTRLAECFTVAFDASASSDADGDRLSYLWEFGDGERSPERTVVHRYPGPGSYAGRLRVIDASGQVASGGTESFEVVIEQPPTAVAGPDVVAATGAEVAFDASGSAPGDRPIRGYLWNFQDGRTAAGATVSHAFTAPGTYRVTLEVEAEGAGPCRSATDQVQVRVNAPPVAEAGSVQRVSVGQVVALDAGRSYDVDGEIVAYRWDLGDGTEASGAVVEHRFAAPGTYPVRLEVEDDAGVANSVRFDTTDIVVNQPPIAVAGPDRRAAVGEVIQFDAAASNDPDGAIVGYGWNFGDGNRGRGAQIPYAYAGPGTYRVTLSVQDASGTDSDRTSDQITVVVNAPPVADAGDDQVVTSSEVRFDGRGSRDPDGEIAEYRWRFGDGSLGSGPAPVHVYQEPGVYLVELEVADDSGTVRSSDRDTIEVVVNEAPIADAGPDLIAAPGQKLTFAATESIDPDGDLTEFLWDFKDGNQAAGEQVEHAFARPGIYRVRLAVRDDTGQEDAIDFDEAKVTVNAPPTADAGPDLVAAPGDAVQLDASNSFDLDGELIEYRWDFSDAPEPMFGSQVVRAYARPGVYSARLTVVDDSGAINATSRDEVAVRINHAPVAAAGDDVFTSDSTVTFVASDSADADGDPLKYRWDFGDGSPPAAGERVTHTYAEGGSYPVVLTVDDGTGLRNGTDRTAITVVIDRPPVAVAGGNRNACAGDIVVFDGAGSTDPEGGSLRHRWDFGDGTGADIVNPTKVYEQGAVYPVTLTVEDDSGFPDNRHTDSIVVRVLESPIADAGPDQTVCAGTDVRFDGSGSRDTDGVVNSYAWDFGDGKLGAGETPTHLFDEPGEYRVVLTIEGDQAGSCSNTNTDEMLVRVVEAPVARITAPAGAPVGTPVTFDARGSSPGPGEIVEWRWDFGDGSTAEGPVVEHAYDAAARHLVTLSIQASAAATDCRAVTAQRGIAINAPPIAVAGEDRLVGIDEEVLFDASRSSDPDGAITSYRWEFGDGASATGVNVRHRFRASGRYPVTLTVIDDADLANSSVSNTVTVTVNPPPEPVIEAPAVACVGEGLTLVAASEDTDGNGVSYSWRFGDGTEADGDAVDHSYREPGVYDLVLVADDGTGLSSGRAQATSQLHVNRPPRAAAGPDRRICPGQPITFDGGASVDWDGELLSYQWDFGDGTLFDGREVVHAFDKPGVYEVGLTVTDDAGSTCSAHTDVARVVVNTAPVADAGADRQGFVGGAHDALLFDASASVDADGEPLSYLWDFGDGVTRAGEKVLHAFGEPGTYPVRLTVSDGSGLDCGAASDEITATVRRRE